MASFNFTFTFMISILLCTRTNIASSFTVQNAYSNNQRNQNLNPRLRPQKATIIGWDDESDSYQSTFDSSIDILSEDTNDDDYTSIKDTLSLSAEKQASLARLAVAFAPPDQALNLENINQIQIIEVTNDHIEISAVVCEESECITLLVPVTFPHDCSTEHNSAEECVLDNIFELDVQAQQVLRQRTVQKAQEGTDKEKELMAELYDTHDVEFPSWWIAPVSNELSEECLSIKKILNQDGFQTQVKALANEGLAFCDDGYLFEIYRAAVCAIGPAGFYFRAIAVKKDEASDSQLSMPLGEDTHCTILDIPYSAFHKDSHTLLDPSSLRAAVLGAVTDVST
jgi:hypothetical protein